MNNDLITRDNKTALQIGRTGNKDIRSRLRVYGRWMDHEKIRWFQPDLLIYRDELFERGLAPTSVAAHLSTIRGAYRRMLRNNRVRDALYDMAPEGSSPADRKAFVDEIITRIENAIDPLNAPVSITEYQDIADQDHLRLTEDEARSLLNSPDTGTLKGLRDRAIIGLLLCTGIREAELISLNHDDLRVRFGGLPALRIRHGKGNKARLIPYGDLEWCLKMVDSWRNLAGIDSGAIFRGLWKGGKKIRRERLSVRAVEYILASYPIEIDSKLRHVRPHDCRRTYARRLYESGMDLVAIQQNLGHADTRTTLRYIGTLDADARSASSLYGIEITT